LICILIIACEKYDFTRVEFTRVITVGAIEVSASSAFLTGDIEGLRAGKVVGSGFVYSEAASTDEGLRRGAPNVINQLSPFQDTITVDRAFAARITGLQQSTTYFFRAYIELEDEMDLAYGSIDSFSTRTLELPTPTVIRQDEGCPTSVTVGFQIGGFSPGPGRSAGFVWSNHEQVNYPTMQSGITVELESVSGGFSGEFEVACDQTYYVRVIIQNAVNEIFYGDVVSFSTESGGSWIEQPAFPGVSIGREGPISFASGHSFYLGAGGLEGRNFNDFYEFVDTLKTWNFINRSDTIELANSSSASLGSIGFALGGRPPQSTCTKCPDEHLQPSVRCICSNDRLLMYDATSQNWSTLAGLSGPSGRILGSALTIEEKLYFGTGIHFHACIESGFCWFTQYSDCGFDDCVGIRGINSSLRYLNRFSDFHSFDESSLNWVAHDNLPGPERMKAVSMEIDDEGYLGMGRQVGDPKVKISSFFENYTTLIDFYKFSPTQAPGTQWTQLDDFPQDYLEAKGFGISSKDLLRQLSNFFKDASIQFIHEASTIDLETFS